MQVRPTARIPSVGIREYIKALGLSAGSDSPVDDLAREREQKTQADWAGKDPNKSENHNLRSLYESADLSSCYDVLDDIISSGDTAMTKNMANPSTSAIAVGLENPRVLKDCTRDHTVVGTEADWLQLVETCSRLEKERTEFFDIARSWREREEEYLIKEGKARRALRLLLEVNANLEEEMQRRTFSTASGATQRQVMLTDKPTVSRSRAIARDMETQERRGDRRLSLIVDVLTRISREQLEGNLLAIIHDDPGLACNAMHFDQSARQAARQGDQQRVAPQAVEPHRRYSRMYSLFDLKLGAREPMNNVNDESIATTDAKLHSAWDTGCWQRKPLPRRPERPKQGRVRVTLRTERKRTSGATPVALRVNPQRRSISMRDVSRSNLQAVVSDAKPKPLSTIVETTCDTPCDEAPVPDSEEGLVSAADDTQTDSTMELARRLSVEAMQKHRRTKERCLTEELMAIINDDIIGSASDIQIKQKHTQNTSSRGEAVGTPSADEGGQRRVMSAVGAATKGKSGAILRYQSADSVHEWQSVTSRENIQPTTTKSDGTDPADLTEKNWQKNLEKEKAKMQRRLIKEKRKLEKEAKRKEKERARAWTREVKQHKKKFRTKKLSRCKSMDSSGDKTDLATRRGSADSKTFTHECQTRAKWLFGKMKNRNSTKIVASDRSDGQQQQSTTNLRPKFLNQLQKLRSSSRWTLRTGDSVKPNEMDKDSSTTAHASDTTTAQESESCEASTAAEKEEQDNMLAFLRWRRLTQGYSSRKNDKMTSSQTMVSVSASNVQARTTFVSRPTPETNFPDRGKGKEKDINEDEPSVCTAVGPLFGQSLNKIMAYQEQENQILDIPALGIPLILYILCHTLLQRSVEGNTEGFFRVTGSLVEVERLKTQLEMRDYDLSAFNTHAIASCLQHWLMELPEPVIPEEFYNECIKNANKQEQTLIIVDQLPEVNKSVVLCICEFVRRLTLLRSYAEKRISQDNLVHIFAPVLLRCGNKSKQFYLSTFEKMFVANLFQSYSSLDKALFSLN